MICSALTFSDCEVEFLDISDNDIIDKDLKLLLALLYHNKSLTDIQYSLTEK